MEGLAEVPYEQLVEQDYVWVGTPSDIVERIEQTLERVRGRQGDRHHRQRRGAPHWMAIKNQELFAQQVMPHFGSAPRRCGR